MKIIKSWPTIKSEIKKRGWRLSFNKKDRISNHIQQLIAENGDKEELINEINALIELIREGVKVSLSDEVRAILKDATLFAEKLLKLDENLNV